MARLFYKDKPLIGIDIDDTNIRLMSIDIVQKKIVAYGSVNLSPEDARESLEGDGEYHVAKIKELLNENIIGEIPSNHAALSVATAKTYTRTFKIPAKLEKVVPEAVTTEADQYIPIPTNTLYIDHQIISRDKDELVVSMSAVSQTIIDNLVSIVKRADLKPVIVEPGINSIVRVLKDTEEAHLPSIVINIGPANTDIAILIDGHIRVTGNSAVGGNTFTLAVAKKLNITLENAHQLKVLNGLNAGSRQKAISEAVTPSLEKIAKEIEKITRYYRERIDNDQKLEQLLIVGSGSNMPGIGDFMTNRLIIPARVAIPWQDFNFDNLEEPPRQFRPHFIAAAGLATIPPGEVHNS